MTAEPTDPAGQDELLVTDDGRVRILTLNRPHRLNALSTSLQDRLTVALLDAGADDGVSVVVLTGAGERAFCPGVDLKELRAREAEGWRGPYRRPARAVWQVLAETGKPTIALLNGDAVGGGFELALACDLVVAVRGARIGLPEATIGLAASFGTAALARRVPHGIACELLFTGALWPVEDAVAWGLVTRVTDRHDVRAEALGLARRIAANAPLSLRRMKESLVKGASLPMMSAVTLDVGPDPYTSLDRREGVRAFLEKRAPVWRGC